MVHCRCLCCGSSVEFPDGRDTAPLAPFQRSRRRRLTPSDFRLTDNGAARNPECARLLETGAQASPLGPSEYTNRPAVASSHSTLVLLDLLNANFGEAKVG